MGDKNGAGTAGTKGHYVGPGLPGTDGGAGGAYSATNYGIAPPYSNSAGGTGHGWELRLTP
jgi:hypothetical protein